MRHLGHYIDIYTCTDTTDCKEKDLFLIGYVNRLILWF